MLLTEYIVFFDRALPCWALLGFSGNGIVEVDVMLFQQLCPLVSSTLRLHSRGIGLLKEYEVTYSGQGCGSCDELAGYDPTYSHGVASIIYSPRTVPVMYPGRHYWLFFLFSFLLDRPVF